MSIDQFAEMHNDHLDPEQYDCLDKAHDCPMEPAPELDRDQQCDQDIATLQSILDEMEGRPGWDETKQTFDRVIDCLTHNGYG
tara:strand:+ start:2594 stop:2842 length:249 start_codon:yes stop_codon:yes gene_type:complete